MGKQLSEAQFKVISGYCRYDISEIREYARIWSKFGYDVPPLDEDKIEENHKTYLETTKTRIELPYQPSSQISKSYSGPSWEYGVTTVPSRFHNEFQYTLDSLSEAGFDNPTIFVDGPDNGPDYESLGLPVVYRRSNIGTPAHWVLSTWEIYMRNPFADKYVIFQDDLITYRNLKDYLDSIQYPDKGYFNLYTFPVNQALAERNGKGNVGWHQASDRRGGLGAVALLFSNEALRVLLSHRHLVDRFQGRKRDKYIDNGISEIMKKAGYQEYIHNPSLVQHIGDVSTMGNAKHPKAKSFRGEEFDATDLLPRQSHTKPRLGDKIHKALNLVGITEERVSNWLGKPCNCSERREELNQLSRWAERVVSGKVEKAKEHLGKLIETRSNKVTKQKPQRSKRKLQNPKQVDEGWSYGITTVPWRFNNEFKQTLNSLKSAGFDKPIIFTDSPPGQDHDYSQFGLPVVYRESNLKTPAHWYLTALELYVREPFAKFYAIFQDDFVTYRNLRQYLEQTEYPDKGYLNLYTFPENHTIAKKQLRDKSGWAKSNQKGRGAVALVFSNEAMRTLLKQQHIVDRFRGPRRYEKIDGGIVDSMKKCGWSEYVHLPTLTQHIGHVSSMGSGKSPQAPDFKGEDFDALNFLETNSTPQQVKRSVKMNRDEAISRMIAPGQPRPGKWRRGVIQIHVTRACDKACFGCTQGSQLKGKAEFMKPEDFEKAVLSLKGYFGVHGVFGGNPALSPYFEDYCKILQKHVPFEKRGLWCNHPKGKGKIMRETFNPDYSNLNVHLDKEAYQEFKRDWPECRVFGLNEDSRHSPVHGSMLDLKGTKFPDGTELTDEVMWEKISKCDINHHWSAMIGMFRGELRAWFCEIAGSQSIIMQDDPNYPDTGHKVEVGWWRKPLQDFSEQVDYHCQRCLFPLKGYGELAQNSDPKATEQTTEFYAERFKPKHKDRPVTLVEEIADLRPNTLRSNVDYIGNSKK